MFVNFVRKIHVRGKQFEKETRFQGDFELACGG